MPDVFDQVAERGAPQGDVFDQVAGDGAQGDIFDQVEPKHSAVKAGYGFVAGLAGGVKSAGEGAARLADPGPLPNNFKNYQRQMIRAGAEQVSPDVALAEMGQEREAQRQALMMPGQAVADAAAPYQQGAQAISAETPGNEMAAKAAGVVGGMLPLLGVAAIPAVGPAAAATVGGLQATGDTYNQAYEFYRKQGLGEVEAQQKADDVAIQTGMSSAALYALLPGSGKAVAEGLMAKQLLTAKPIVQAAVRTLAQAGEGSAVMGVNSLVTSAQAMRSYRPELTWSEAVNEAAKQAAEGFVATGVVHGALEGIKLTRGVPAAVAPGAVMGNPITEVERPPAAAAAPTEGAVSDGAHGVTLPTLEPGGQVAAAVPAERGNDTSPPAPLPGRGGEGGSEPGGLGAAAVPEPVPAAQPAPEPPQITGLPEGALFQGVRPDNAEGQQGKSGWLTDDINLAGRFTTRTGESGSGRIDVYSQKDLPSLDDMKESDKSKPGSNVYSFASLSRIKPIGTVGLENGQMVFKPATPAAPEAQPALAGPGGTVPEDVATQPQLAQLTDSVTTLARKNPFKVQINAAYNLGKAVAAIKDGVSDGLLGLRAAGQYLTQRIVNRPVWDSWKQTLGRRQVALSESVLKAREWQRQALRAVPDPVDREAIANWLDAGGDDAVLKQGAAETKPQYRAGYQRARGLDPALKVVAENVRNYFESRLQEAQGAGILEDGIANYIHRMYEKDSGWKRSVMAEIGGGLNTGRPGLAKKRVFQYDFEAEKAGYKPVKNFIDRITAYDVALNKAIADREAVKAMMAIKMPDGRPMIDVGGVGIPVEGTAKAEGALMIKPQFRVRDDKTPLNHRGDYEAFNHAALRKWRWVGEGLDGGSVLVQGDVLVHPDAISQVRKLLGRSAIQQHWLGRAALAGSSTVKQTMLDLSGFHPVQITVHGWEHRTFKPVEKIDFENPVHRDLVAHGLVVTDWRGHQLWSEGLSGTSLTRYIPKLGPRLQAYNEWLFGDYIPRLKMAMGAHALERNRERYPKMSNDEVLHLTANQANAAFGELNYELLGRSKTTQDILRLGLLAPDFLEARARFAGQALTKYGGEQRAALLLGAATLYMTARIINKLLTDQYQLDPKNAFNVVYKGKAYSLRTVQGDILHLISKPENFVRMRANPVTVRTAVEAFTGRDVFGRKRTALQQMQDVASTLIPISVRGLLTPREQTLTESLINALGVTERRATSTDEVMKLAQDFNKKRGYQHPGEFVYDPDKDVYRPLKLALAYNTPADAAQELATLLNGQKAPAEVVKYFKAFATKEYTGSGKNENAFFQSLTTDQKRTYAEAKVEKKAMVANLVKAIAIYKAMPKPPGKAPAMQAAK